VAVEDRIRSAFALYVYAALGVFLVAAPWTAVWDQAALALIPAVARDWIQSGWVRGIVSGLGALDLVVALQYAGRMWGEPRAEPKKRRP
jgi:hypothetical protein